MNARLSKAETPATERSNFSESYPAFCKSRRSEWRPDGLRRRCQWCAWCDACRQIEARRKSQTDLTDDMHPAASIAKLFRVPETNRG
jgi:hypothetical protein